jgi:hypothetical protein
MGQEFSAFSEGFSWDRKILAFYQHLISPSNFSVLVEPIVPGSRVGSAAQLDTNRESRAQPCSRVITSDTSKPLDPRI